jgi:hypothetical protein
MAYSIRMLERGFGVRLGVSNEILQDESPLRDWSRMGYYGRRNNVMFAWQNVPCVVLLAAPRGTLAKGMWCGEGATTCMGYGTSFGMPLGVKA